MKPVQTLAAAKVAHIFHRIGRFRASPTNADECLHRLHPLILLSEIPFPDRFAHEFRDRGRLGARSGVKSVPEIFVEV